MTTMQLTNEPKGQEFNSDIRADMKAQASMLAGVQVHYLFRPHVTDLETGRHGVRWLIARILTEAGAVAVAGQQPEAVMTTATVIARVRQAAGPDRYTDLTVRQYLAVIMRKSGQTASVQTARRQGLGRPQLSWWLITPAK